MSQLIPVADTCMGTFVSLQHPKSTSSLYCNYEVSGRELIIWCDQYLNKVSRLKHLITLSYTFVLIKPQTASEQFRLDNFDHVMLFMSFPTVPQTGTGYIHILSVPCIVQSQWKSLTVTDKVKEIFYGPHLPFWKTGLKYLICAKPEES